MSRRPRSLLAAALAATAAALSAGPASADVGTSDCNTPASSPVFSPWADTTNYFLAPDGGFEAGAAGWALSGATVVAGNESFNLSGPGTSSVKLGGNDSATSPEVCVGLEHPTFRFTMRKASGGARAALVVSVVLPDGTAIPVGATYGTSLWSPSPVMLVGANLLPLITGNRSTQVRFRFTPTSGSWQIDDVYVDPRGGT